MLETARLRLRSWCDADRERFAALNADARVMEHLPSTLTRAQSDALAARISGHIEANGFGLWAVDVPGVEPFIGFVGLQVPSFEAPFTPCVEAGWRLAHSAWGRGYATEAARAAIDDGFARLRLREILAWTVPSNVRSQRVMASLGMRRSPDEDFDHPNLPQGHPLRRHMLYRLAHWQP